MKNETFGDMLKSLMALKGFSQEEISNATSINKSTISKYVNNMTKPKLENIIAIAVSLRLTYCQSEELLKRCNMFLFSNNELIVSYRFFLSECSMRSEITVEWCNKFLKNHSLPVLVDQNKKQDL